MLNPGPESLLLRQALALVSGTRQFREPQIPASPSRPECLIPLVWPPGLLGARDSGQRPGPSGPAGGGGAQRPGACARTSHSAARGRPLASRGGKPARAPHSRSARTNRCRPRSRSAGLHRPGTSPGPRSRVAASASVRAIRGPALPEPPCARPRRGCSLARAGSPSRPPLPGGARNEPASAPGCRSEGRGPATSHAAKEQGLGRRGWARPGSGRRG